MKTLPQAIIDGKDGGSERVILVRIIPVGGGSPDPWAEFDWATKDIVIENWEGGGDKTFVGGVLKENSFSPIRQSVDVTEAGNVARLSGLSFTVANPEYDGENRFDKYFDTSRFENRTVEIWLAFWTGSNPDYTDVILLYTGVIVDVEYNYGEYKIEVENAALQRHKDIPDLILTRDDYPTMPDPNVNAYAPLIYGKVSGDSPATGAKIYAPMILVDEGKNKFVMSRNKMKSLAITLYRYHEDANAWQRIYPVGVGGDPYTYVWNRPSTIQVINSTTGAALFLGDFWNLCTHQGSQTSPATKDIENVIDRADTLALKSITLNGTEKLFLKVDIPSNLGTIFDEGSGKLTLRVRQSDANGSPAGKICYYNPETDTFSTGVQFSTGAPAIIDYDFGSDKSAKGNSDTWTAEEIAKFEWGIWMYSFTSVKIRSITMIINGVLIRYYSPYTMKERNPREKAPRRRRREPKELISQLGESMCGNLQGACFGSWIDESQRNSSYNDGDLIDMGVYHIEAILRDELGLDDDEIDVESFDLVSGDDIRGLWPFANILNQSQDSLEIIKDFCRCGGLMFFTNYQNKEKVVAIYNDLNTERIIDRTTMYEESVKISLTPLDSVYNDFDIKHHKQWVRDSYLEKVHLNAYGTNLDDNQRGDGTYTGLCVDSVLKYNMQRKLEFEMDWSSNYDDGADHLTKWFAEWLCYRKYVVEFKSGLDHIDLELGDQVFIDHPLLPESVRGSALFILFDISHDLNEDKIRFKFIQIPEPEEVAMAYGQTKIVAKSGGDHTTIQAAIDAITDATVSKPYVVLIYPGIYQEAITMKAYVFLVGVDRNACRIETNTDNNAVDISVTGKTGLFNLYVKGYSDKACIYIDSDNSDIVIDHCIIEPQGGTTGYGLHVPATYNPYITIINTTIESSTALCGLYIIGAPNCNYRNLKIILTASLSKNCLEAGNHEFHSCHLESHTYGLEVDEMFLRLYHCMIKSTDGQGIRFTGSVTRYVLAYHCTIFSKTGAFVLSTSSGTGRLDHCFLEAEGTDKSTLDISGSDAIKLFNCVLRAGPGTSYSVWAVSAQDIVMSNCTVSDDVHSNVTVNPGSVYETTNVKNASL